MEREYGSTGSLGSSLLGIRREGTDQSLLWEKENAEVDDCEFFLRSLREGSRSFCFHVNRPARS